MANASNKLKKLAPKNADALKKLPELKTDEDDKGKATTNA